MTFSTFLSTPVEVIFMNIKECVLYHDHDFSSTSFCALFRTQLELNHDGFSLSVVLLQIFNVNLTKSVSNMTGNNYL